MHPALLCTLGPPPVGDLEPVLTVQPEEVTTQLGEVAKLAVSLAGKITEDSYTGRILLNFTSGRWTALCVGRAGRYY